uniref:PIN domain-containing protein n=1 Tax=Staphylothermus marinus TaxID=2280 RepID=A0A7C4HDG2_STAMA
MREKVVYLDSSVIIKRYIEEPGSEYVRQLYTQAYNGLIRITYSLWNIGEILGVLEKSRTRGIITVEDYQVVKKRFLSETLRLTKLGYLIIIPVKLSILRVAWRIIEKHNIYQADALQIASAKSKNVDEFLVADKKLHQIALEEGLNSKYIA